MKNRYIELLNHEYGEIHRQALLGISDEEYQEMIESLPKENINVISEELFEKDKPSNPDKYFVHDNNDKDTILFGVVTYEHKA